MSALEVRWWVALRLKPGAAPLRRYIGEVAAVDENGLRLTLVDWPRRVGSGVDLFFPWQSVASVLVAIDLCGLEGFRDQAARCQEQGAEGGV